jgi:A/G-specific adenine glycosylase
MLSLSQAMMELGATVCKPVNPSCSSCPVSSCCAAYKLVTNHAPAGGSGSGDMEDAPHVTDFPEKVCAMLSSQQVIYFDTG